MGLKDKKNALFLSYLGFCFTMFQVCLNKVIITRYINFNQITTILMLNLVRLEHPLERWRHGFRQFHKRKLNVAVSRIVFS